MRHVLHLHSLSFQWMLPIFWISQNYLNSTPTGKKDADKKPVLISKAVWMNFGQGEDTSGELKKHPNEVWLRCSYNTDVPWSKVSLLKGRKRSPPSRVVALPGKYPNGHAIKSKKLEDLEKMIPFLPTENRQFYLDLLASVPRDPSDDSDDD